MSELIIVAGPQAAGKTTIIGHLCSEYQSISPLFFCANRKLPPIFPLQESRQIIVHRDILLGAIFMTGKQEEDIIACDLGRMDLILKHAREKRIVYMDECNIFTIAHALAHGVKSGQNYWQEYINRLTRLNTKVIFLDVDPETSWERRQAKYRQRLVYFPTNRHESIMRRYQEYLKRLHPLLLDVYDRLPFPKQMLSGRALGKDNVRGFAEALIKISDSFRPLHKHCSQ